MKETLIIHGYSTYIVSIVHTMFFCSIIQNLSVLWTLCIILLVVLTCLIVLMYTNFSLDQYILIQYFTWLHFTCICPAHNLNVLYNEAFLYHILLVALWHICVSAQEGPGCFENTLVLCSTSKCLHYLLLPQFQWPIHITQLSSTVLIRSHSLWASFPSP